MNRLLTTLLAAAVAATAAAVAAQEAASQAPQRAEPLPKDYSCTECHRKDSDWLPPDAPHLIVTEEDLAADIHWQSGLRCHDCHGGSPVFEEFVVHRDDPNYHAVESPADIPAFCGRCHSDIEYMRRYGPSARTDQEAEYWTSGHGKRLKQAVEDHQKAMEAYQKAVEAGQAPEGPPEFEAPKVATCVDCHHRHGIRAVNDRQSPVYPTRVAETCAVCHADAELMAGLEYHGRPVWHNQYDLWRESVHGRALLEEGDLSAPTCNDCHGNHGAMPPDVDSVANACGACHGKVADLFAQTRMMHRFEEAGLPGCATCHGSHQTLSPSDEMLGMTGHAVCVECHEQKQYGATLAGGDVARTMRTGLEELKRQIAEAEAKIAEAERLGMEVRGPRFDLRLAFDALTNARSLIHSFSPDPVNEALDEGLRVTSEVKRRAEEALRQHTFRRVWLAASLVPILLVVTLLLLYIRTLPPVSSPSGPPSGPGLAEEDQLGGLPPEPPPRN